MYEIEWVSDVMEDLMKVIDDRHDRIVDEYVCYREEMVDNYVPIRCEEIIVQSKAIHFEISFIDEIQS